MATVAGTIYLNGCNYQFQYDILSQSQANNTTTVRFYGVLNVTNAYVSWSNATRVWVHYAERSNFGTYFTRGSYTLVQGDFTFTHNTNGDLTITPGYGITTSFVSGSSTVSITLPHIDRFATLSSAQDFTDEGNPKITFTKNVASGSTVYAGIFNSAGTTAYASYRDISSSVSSGEYTFNLTTAERNALRNAIPNAKTMQVQFKMYTTISGTNYDGGSITKTMSITNANPTLTSPTYSEQNSKVSALLGTSGSTVVQNASTLRIGITTTALKGASISKVVATHSGSTYTDTSSPYNFDIPIKSNSITLTATDSRTNTGTLNITKTMLSYTPVAINNLSFKRQTETSGVIILNLTATYYQQTFGSTANAPIVKWKKDDGSWTTLTSSQYTIDNTNHKLTVSNLSLGEQVDYEHEATFYLSIEDKLSSAQDNRKVIIGIPTMELGKNDVKINGDLSFAENNNASILWKESGYGDKFRIIPAFSGSDDDNKLKIQGTVGGYGTDPTNFTDLLAVSGKTGHVDISGATHSIRGFWSRPSGQVGTATSDSNSCLLIKRASSSEAPNNGVVLEYGNSASYRGQLYIGDNATQGIYYNGWSNGTRGTWRRLADEPISLYDNGTGTTGTVSLSESAANFKYIEIYYYLKSSNTNHYASTKVYSPNNKKVSLISTSSTSSALIVGSENVTISGTSITVNNNGTYMSFTSRAAANEVWIYKVIGYR